MSERDEAGLSVCVSVSVSLSTEAHEDDAMGTRTWRTRRRKLSSIHHFAAAAAVLFSIVFLLRSPASSSLFRYPSILILSSEESLEQIRGKETRIERDVRELHGIRRRIRERKGLPATTTPCSPSASSRDPASGQSVSR